MYQEMKVTVYNFFKVGNHYEYLTKDKEIVTITMEMMDCLLNQYKMQGWFVFQEENTVSVSYAHQDMKAFTKRLMNS